MIGGAGGGASEGGGSAGGGGDRFTGAPSALGALGDSGEGGGGSIAVALLVHSREQDNFEQIQRSEAGRSARQAEAVAALLMVGTIGGTPLAKRLNVPGGSPRMLELVARYADIWNCPWINDPGDVPGILSSVSFAARASRCGVP